MYKYVITIPTLGLVAACSGQDPVVPAVPMDVAVSVQEVRAGQSETNNFLSLDILATDHGVAIPCDEGFFEVTVGVGSSAEGPFEEIPDAEYTISCTDGELADVALVVDNSGSEDGYLPWLQESARVMVDAVVPSGGRASLTRVSTDSSVWLPLSDDGDVLHEQIDGLYILNGWTALYDGIRMGNETLGGGFDAANEDMTDLESFCQADRKLGVVAFTDGRENNSANQSYGPNPDYPGDAIDTTLDDLHSLQVNNVTTPIYTIGLGEEVDHEGLGELAEFTGGRHHAVEDESDLPDVFQAISDYMGANHKICTELPPELCGDVYISVSYRWTACNPASPSCQPEEGESASGSKVFDVHVDCPIDPKGKVATVLLTMSNPGITRDQAKTLAVNTVNWVSPVDDPTVLVIKDDNHHNEFAQDPEYVHELLVEAGFDATLVAEPQNGIDVTATSGYDVIWFSNPGYPPDDKSSLYALETFADGGGGYVLQGDDFTWVFGDSAFSLSSATGVVHESNGTSFCGKRIDNNATSRSYHVMVDGDPHPVIAGLEGVEFNYGDDIDSSHPAEIGEQVLAWANGVESNGEVYCDKLVPVIIVREP